MSQCSSAKLKRQTTVLYYVTKGMSHIISVFCYITALMLLALCAVPCNVPHIRGALISVIGGHDTYPINSITVHHRLYHLIYYMKKRGIRYADSFSAASINPFPLTKTSKLISLDIIANVQKERITNSITNNAGWMKTKPRSCTNYMVRQPTNY